MAFQHHGALRYYVFDRLQVPEITHAIFTRQGGVSPSPWEGLNFGGLVGDDIQRVEANRQRAFQALNRAPQSLYDVWQVHSADVVCATKPRPLDQPHTKADAILTDRPDVTLLMRFADCVPILLYDPNQRVIGLVHAGWQGTVRKVIQAAVERMQTQYGCHPADLYAGIGPSIGPHHYQVGPEVVAQVQDAFGLDAASLLPTYQGASHFDLWTANRLLLERAGVEQIEVAGLCTACHLEDWYSHRAEQGQTGRFGALIALNE